MSDKTPGELGLESALRLERINHANAKLAFWRERHELASAKITAWENTNWRDWRRTVVEPSASRFDHTPLTKMFHPSSNLPPIVCEADPASYHALGEQFDRGDPRRTMSRSELREFGRCPRRWLRGVPDKPTNASEWGSLIDCLALTPTRFSERYVIAPATYPAKGKKKDDPVEDKPWNWNADYCKEWRANQNGATVIKEDEASRAQLALHRLFEDDEIKALFAVSKKQVQVNVEWHDEPTGRVVPFKCLIDLMPDPTSEFGDMLADLKTTGNADYREWCRTIYREGYFYQAAVYLAAVNAATGLDYKTFSHVIQESDEPFETTIRMMSAEFVTIGRNDFTNDMREYCRSLASKHFRGLDRQIAEPEAFMAA